MKAIEPPPTTPAKPQDNMAVVALNAEFDDDIADTGWLKILCEVEEENSKMLQMPTSEQSISNTMMQQRNSPMFSNCKIGNIIITINKK